MKHPPARLFLRKDAINRCIAAAVVQIKKTRQDLGQVPAQEIVDEIIATAQTPEFAFLFKRVYFENPFVVFELLNGSVRRIPYEQIELTHWAFTEPESQA